MADQFFVTSLAGQISYPKIPDEFFTNHLEGKNELVKLKLTSDAFDKTWEVKLNGRRFAAGWENFSAAHSLREDDVLVFRHDGDMAFHVSASGRSFSQIQCVSSSSGDSEDNGDSDEDDPENVSRRRIKTDSPSSEDTCLIPVTTSNLRLDRVCIGKPFAETNGLDKRVCEIELMNQSQKSWLLGLRYNRVTGQNNIRGGWRSFCLSNKLKIGFSYRFKLVKNGTKPVLQLCSSGITPKRNCSKPHGKSNVSSDSEDDHDEDSEDNGDDSDDGEYDVSDSKKKSRFKTESSSPKEFCHLASTPSNLRLNRVTLSKPFTRANGLNERCCQIDLMNPSGKSWTHSLRYNATTEQASIGVGWRSFCRANKLKTGFSYQFKLVKNGTIPVLQLCTLAPTPKGNCSKPHGKSNVSTESSSSDNEDDDDAEDSVDDDDVCNDGGSEDDGDADGSDEKFCLIAATPSNLHQNRVKLSNRFTRANSLNKKRCCEIDVMNPSGKSWTHSLKYYATTHRACIGLGWRSFCRANKLKTGTFYRFKFVENGARPSLQLCSDVILEGNCSKSGIESGSASVKQSKFLTVTYKPYMLESRQLHLPIHFVKVNGIKEAEEINLVDKYGVKWPSHVAYNSRHGVQFCVSKNLIQFCAANGLKTGETIRLEFVRGEDTTPMLKFCSMAKIGQTLCDGSDEDEEAQEKVETPVQKRARVSAEGGPSRRTRASNNASADPRPNSIFDQLTKVKQNIVDTLNDVKRWQSELEIKKKNLQATLQDLDTLEGRVLEINKLVK